MSLPGGRGRRIALALLILLLIFLPLYLWPLRGGLGALPWAAALTGSAPKDPRDAAALADIPRDVWDALLNVSSGTAHGSAGSHEGRGAQNLTMIMAGENGDGSNIPDSPSGLPSGDEPPPGLLASVTGPTEGKSDEPDPSPPSTTGSSSPGELDSWPLVGGGQGHGAGPWPGGGGGGRSRGFPTALGGIPFTGDEASVGPPTVIVLGPGDPIAPHPAPEPGTVALVGLNVLLLAGIAWNHRRNKEARARIG